MVSKIKNIETSRHFGQHTLRMLVVLLGIWSLIIGCSSISRSTAEGKTFVFIDSIQASKKIISDDVEGYFQQVSQVDMSIQMKTPIVNNLPDQKSFQAFLAREVCDWKSSEKEAIESTIQEAIDQIKKVNARCIPRFSLIKIKTNHYGEDVYYTRGNSIFVPENIFEKFDKEEQLPIFIHEIFHIISKNHENYRRKLYALIGFHFISPSPTLPKELADLLLTNPDGVSRNYAINLKEISGNEEPIWAIPLIKSPVPGYQADKPGFFDYLSFDLYQLEKRNGAWQVLTDRRGNSTLELNKTPRFFTQIKDNTQYIIHPDEIMADNFMLGVLAYNKNDYSRFSPAGKALIEAVISLTKEYSFE